METFVPKKKLEDKRILLGPFESLKEFNFGIFIIAMHFLLEFGSFQGLFPILKTLKIPYIFSALSILYAALLVFQGKVDFKSDVTRKFFILCVFIIAYSLLYTEIEVFRIETSKVFLLYLSHYIIIVSCIKKPSQFILLIDVWIMSIVFSSFHGIMQGGLIWGNRWLNDENHISLVVATAIPFALILFREFKLTTRKSLYVLALVFYVAVNVVAASRGGALSMILVAFLSWLLLRHKVRILIIMLLAVILVLNYAPKHFFEEMETLEEGTEEGTADDRIYLWGIAMDMFDDYPVLGVGPMNYPAQFSAYEQGRRYPLGVARVPHSTPVQWLAETGVIGSMLLLLLFRALYKNWKLAAIIKNHPKYKDNEDRSSIFVNITHACAIAQIGFWFGAFFLSLMEFPFYWCLVPFSEVWKNLTLKEIERLDKLEEESPTIQKKSVSFINTLEE